VAEAQAAVRQAEAQVALLEAGVRPETIAVAEADVAAAEATLAQAQAVLSDTELRAPFAGVVAALNVNLGEQTAAGAPVVSLADLSRWQIETEDLTEFDVVGVRPNDKVMLSFDALPDLRKDGVVARIRPIGQDNRGDIVYTLVIDPAQQDERLLWNMTAVVEIGK
jgi:HlyD family secretion protein